MENIQNQAQSNSQVDETQFISQTDEIKSNNQNLNQKHKGNAFAIFAIIFNIIALIGYLRIQSQMDLLMGLLVIGWVLFFGLLVIDAGFMFAGGIFSIISIIGILRKGVKQISISLQVISLINMLFLCAYAFALYNTGKNVTTDDNTRYYQENMMGTDADKNSFEYLFNDFSKDENHVYFRTKIIQGADPITFGEVSEIATSRIPYLSRDKNNIYFKDKKMEGIDANSFECFADRYEYYDEKYLEENAIYYKDKNHVYYGNSIIENADIESFQVLTAKDIGSYGYYAKDDNYAYYKGIIIPGADAPSFEYIDEYYSELAEDKNHKYKEGKIRPR